MMCNTCLYFAYESADTIIRFICGHHPNCPHFSIDKKEFINQFNQRVDREVSKKMLLNALYELEEQPQQKSSSKIIKQLYQYLSHTHFPIASNCYIYNWESDLITINENKQVTEYEVKISRNDYKADFRKDKKHASILDAYQYNCNSELIPNYFYYVITPGLLDKKEIPLYAGLIEVGLSIRIVKQAPLLHELNAPDDMEMKILKKVYTKYWK